jgi:hypothetical protein
MFNHRKKKKLRCDVFPRCFISLSPIIPSILFTLILPVAASCIRSFLASASDETPIAKSQFNAECRRLVLSSIEILLQAAALPAAASQGDRKLSARAAIIYIAGRARACTLVFRGYTRTRTRA